MLRNIWRSSAGWFRVAAHGLVSQHRWDLAPAIETAQPDLSADHETEEQHERGVLGGQRALGLHPPPELFIQPLDAVGGAERLPLRLGKIGRAHV